MRARAVILYVLLALAHPGVAEAADGVAPSGMADSARIAVLAFRGAERAVSRWKPTADYLSAQVPGRTFEIVPLSLQAMGPAVAGGDVDFVLTNTGNYVALEAAYGISRIVTLRSPQKVAAGNVFGAVIFTRADRDDIKNLGDLAGKSLMAVQRHGFGGFQMGWHELQAQGIDPFSDLSRLEFSGFPQDRVAFAVKDGKVDAGTFRTGTLEAMSAEGRIRLEDFKILGPRDAPGFPFLLSTRLYPEWPFAKLKGTSQDLAQKVAVALLGMGADDPAAVAGAYGGWTVPLDYTPVHDLFRELRIGPYADLGRVSFTDLMREWGAWIMVALVMLAAAVGWAARVEHQVARRTRELSDANLELERQIAERRRAEEEARKRRAELAHAQRLSTMGEMASGLAHELNQPLAAITNYARGGVRRLRAGNAESDAFLSALEAITSQAERAAKIIRRMRAMVRKQGPNRQPMDLNAVVREVAGLMRAEADRLGVELVLDLDPDLAPVLADVVQMEQVVLNLTRNGLEALGDGHAGPRRLTIRTTQGKGKQSGVVRAVVGVADTGPGFGAPGIETDEPERVFDPFYTTKERGLGLGLSISRSIVERQGGRLWAERGADGGAIFRFTVPFAEPAPDSLPKPKEEAVHEPD